MELKTAIRQQRRESDRRKEDMKSSRKASSNLGGVQNCGWGQNIDIASAQCRKESIVSNPSPDSFKTFPSSVEFPDSALSLSKLTEGSF